MPDWRAELRRRLASARLEPTREAEIVDELAQHLDERHAELLARGVDRAAADAAVLAELEQDDLLASRVRAETGPARRPPPILGASRGSVLADLGADLRYAVRALAKKPGFAAITLLTLALGIGANTAIFQMIDTLHLQLLPVAHPEELGLIKIANSTWRMGRSSGRHPDHSFKQWEAIRQRQEGFTDVMAWGDSLVNLAPSGVARYARALFVSGNAFELLGVRPLLGRTFAAADDVRGCTDPGAVVSHGFWQRELGGDPSALGRKLTLEGHAVTVIGIAPASFFGLEIGRSFDVAIPLCMERELYGEAAISDLEHGFWLSVVGRLRPGWSFERASAQLAAASPSLFESTTPSSYSPKVAEKYRAFRLGVFPAATGISEMRDRYSKPLAFLMGIAALLLLIACANLANLFLARASARERELTIRLAIGASRARLVRQLMAESLLIAVVGAALGLLVARGLTDFLVATLSTPGDGQLFLDLGPTWRVLAFTVGVATFTCLLFGLTPALRASRVDVGGVLKATGQALTDGCGRFGLRRALVAVQVALSFVLLFGALLFVRSLGNLVTLDRGFRDDVMTVAVDARIDLPPERRVAFVEELLERVRAVAGVEAAATTRIVPLSGSGWNDQVWMDGASREQASSSMFHRVSPGYFATLGATLVAGRDFGPRDRAGAPAVAIVTERFAQKFAPGEPSPVGKRFHIARGPQEADKLVEIIGVVRDMKYRTLREKTQPTVFVALAQDEDPETYTNLVVRGRVTGAQLVRAITDFEPRLVLEIDGLAALARRTVLVEKLMAELAAFFGLLAALLAVIGLYGVVSYSVARRVHEIGIRMALGADARRVARLILGEAAWLLAAGLVAGLVLALVAARATGALLYGLAPHDPATVVVAIAAMAAVTVLASLIPARRAARTDPMAALRDE